MSFDKPTRNALARMVARIRERLAEDITAQLQTGFRLQPDGTVLPLDGLTEDQCAAAEELRQLLEHFAATLPQAPQPAGGSAAAYDRLVREIGFTVLNRLAALRLCEERGLVVECVRKGMASDGFLLFDRLTGGALGPRYATYRAFLENLFDELALDLGVLFDRHSPLSHVFPAERALEDVLALLNDPALAHLWREDETIGWIYQYYNDEAERKQMREESQAPRNSRELAVRNQFFTPRYVVEFLTDNTLGRLWYQMRQGETALVEKCRYLVRRQHSIFLQPAEELPGPFLPSASNMGDPDLAGEMWMRPNPAIEDISSIFHYALTVGGYDYARERWGVECADLANERSHRYGESGQWEGTFEELRCCLFFEQRRYHHFGQGPEGEDEAAIKELYKAICQRWDLEVETVPHRQKKDPREIKMLDPAGGSGHFGLYCFDLFETIYAEAYDDPDLGPALQADYHDRAAFLRDVPRLILAHNLHVVDIDPRACQIAALALWLRAQRSWQVMGLKPGERPRIRKANVVCAEPMPGERDLLEEFVAALHPPELGELVRFVFERMELAGEAGSLLKIEEELRAKIEKLKVKTGPLFAQGDFWDRAEPAVLQALKEYAEHTANGRAASRRLFADDAAQGFAFIDLCRQRYDVVLMNPPFGVASRDSKPYVERAFPRTKNDVYAAFIERGLGRLEPGGMLGAITSRTGFFLSSFQKWREQILLQEAQPVVFADLGYGVLDAAMVETAAYCLESGTVRKSLFFRLLPYDDKAAVLAEALGTVHAGYDHPTFYVVDPMMFRQVPGSPFAYWILENLNRAFNLPRFEPTAGRARRGPSSGDDARRLRAWWEVFSSDIGRNAIWVSYPKGGNLSPFYADIPLVVSWDEKRRTFRDFFGRPGREIERPECLEDFFLPGLTWPRRASRFSPSVMPSNCIFSVRGQAILSDRSDLPVILGITNSLIFDYIFKLSLGRFGFPEFIAGVLQRLPWAEPDDVHRQKLSAFALNSFQIKRKQDTANETSHVFHLPALLQVGGDVLASQLAVWQAQVRLTEQQLDEYQREADDIAFRLYGIEGDDDRRAIKASLQSDAQSAEGETGEEESGTTSAADAYGSTVDLLSYLLGCAFGRWDIRIALDPTLAPQLQDPFDPLPVCPPGMLVGPDGLPATSGHIVSEEWLRARPNAITLPPADLFDDRPPTQHATRNTQPSSRSSAIIPDSAYPLYIAWDGILVDDPGLDDRAEHPHPADIVRRVREALAVLWSERAEVIEAEACEILGVASLRDYFRKPTGFFADHLKRYSKSRRQAPIYWPLSTASGRYTVWLYYHCLTQDTLYTVVNQYVTPKLDEVQKRIDLLTGRSDLAGLGRPARSAAELRDQLNDLKGFQSELADFRTELLRVAALPYKPDLNDGVIINAAPLHRLFRLRKWTNDTAAVWKKLEAGEYDWAHLAYTLWPERVKQVCETDRSIAIAHGLEALCKVEVKQAKRKGRKKAESETETMGIGSEDE